MKALFDTHVHSCYSVDSEQPLDGILDKARKDGLCALSVTDHFDIGLPDTGQNGVVLTDGYAALDRLRRETAGESTEILCGIELGGAVYDFALAESIVASHDYDIVISSLHNTKEEEYFFMPWRKMTEREIGDTLADYFRLLCRQARHGAFDTLAHLNYPTRYLRRNGIAFSSADYADLTDDVLTALAEGGKALEINTSGLIDVFHETLPGIGIIRRFRELGGEYLTFGSDAHDACRIGENFSAAAQIAAEAGFRYLTYYKRRQPVAVKIT